jgi:hypothetical protein
MKLRVELDKFREGSRSPYHSPESEFNSEIK